MCNVRIGYRRDDRSQLCGQFPPGRSTERRPLLRVATSEVTEPRAVSEASIFLLVNRSNTGPAPTAARRSVIQALGGAGKLLESFAVHKRSTLQRNPFPAAVRKSYFHGERLVRPVRSNYKPARK